MKVKSCFGCDGQCCRYIRFEIAKPDDYIDFEQLKHYVSHENVEIQIEKENHMYLEFKTPCKYQDPETNLCTRYHDRPDICRKYQIKECEAQEDVNKGYKRVLRTTKDVIELKKEVQQAKIKELEKVIELIKKSKEEEDLLLEDIDQKNQKAFEEGKELKKRFLASK